MAEASRQLQLFLVLKVDEKDVPPGAVLRDLEKIYSSLESALPGQGSTNVRQRDRAYRSYDDVAVTHAIATSYLHVTALPYSHRARNLASADSLTELFREDHVARFLKESSLLATDAANELKALVGAVAKH